MARRKYSNNQNLEGRSPSVRGYFTMEDRGRSESVPPNRFRKVVQVQVQDEDEEWDLFLSMTLQPGLQHKYIPKLVFPIVSS